MIKFRLFVLILPLLPILTVEQASGQPPTTVGQDQPLDSTANEAIELVRMAADHYGLSIYYNPSDLAGVTVSGNDLSLPAAEALRRAFAATNINVSEYAGRIYLIKGWQLITWLPEGIFVPGSAAAPGFDSSGIALAGGDSGSVAAGSANKLYIIGTPASVTGSLVELRGTVTDFSNDRLLQGVRISTADNSVSTTTSRTGEYMLRLPAGRYELNIEGMDVDRTVRHITLHSSGVLDIEIEGKVYEVEEVRVTGSRIENVRGTVLGAEQLRMTEIKNVPTAFGEADVMRIVMSLPGVKTASEASSGLNVRGGATDQNLILFNNGTVFNPTHLFGFFSAFNPDVVRDMELYKSSIPARYGGRISSVLDINGREGNKEKYTGSASIGVLTSRLALEGPIVRGKTAFLVGGRTTYSDWILRQLPEKSGYKDGKAGFYDLNAVVSHRFSERDNLVASGYYSRDRFSLDKEEKYVYQNATANLRWTHVFSPEMIGNISAGYDYYHHNTARADTTQTAYSYSFGIEQFYGKGDFTWQRGNHSMEFGASLLHINLNPGEYDPNGSFSLVQPSKLQAEKALEAGIYVGDRWDITRRLSLDMALRYSFYTALGPRTYNIYDDRYLPSLTTITGTETKDGAFKTYHGPEVRVSARYEFVDGFSVKAGFNTLRQNIHKISNSTVVSPTDTWKLSDVNIKPQTGTQSAVGLYKNLAGNTIELSVEGYYKTMQNYLDYRGGARLVMNPSIETDVLPTKGRAYGIEFMVKKTVGNLSGWVSYTYSKTELKQADKKIESPVNGGDWYPADYDKPHEVKFVGNYKITQRFSFSVNLDYSTGRPVTLPVSKYEYFDKEYIYYGERNGYRVDDYFRMDASFNIEPRHRHTQRTHSSFTAGVYNLTGRKNVYSVYYRNEDGELKGYKMAIFGVPIPFISYNIKF